MDYIAAACLLDQSDASSDEEFENTLGVFYLLQQGSKKERKIYPRSFVLDELDDDVCWTNFRFQKEDIPRLAEALNLPEFIKTSNNLTISRVEALCVLLRRLAYPSRLTDVGAVFGRHAADISTISNQVLNLIYELHNQRLSTFDHPWLNLAALSQKVTDKGSPIQECFGFIDGTVRPIARPTQNQREVFSGHKRVHALKFQAVTGLWAICMARCRVDAMTLPCWQRVDCLVSCADQQKDTAFMVIRLIQFDNNLSHPFVVLLSLQNKKRLMRQWAKCDSVWNGPLGKLCSTLPFWTLKEIKNCSQTLLSGLFAHQLSHMPIWQRNFFLF